MPYPDDAEVFAFIRDYERDFGARVPVDDARQILTLYTDLCDLLERYGGDDMQPWMLAANEVLGL